MQHFRFDIENFKKDILTIHKNFGISISNKIHIIINHVEDYIAESGRGLGHVTDRTVEALHSEKHGQKLCRGILHFSSYNI